jgi:predicted nicotinamide N-methyase
VFKISTRQLGSVERAYPLVVPLPLDPRDASPLSVLIRQVPVRMTGQPKTGYLLWGAARVLARWIHAHRDLLDGKSVLEVGSGLGLGGITAARYAGLTILTDYQDDTCRALEYNVALNRAFTHALDATKPDVAVERLDWDSLESIQGVCESPKPKVDVIIGCDIICEPSTADGFLRVVRHRLSAHGVAYLMNADAHSRFGVAYLHEQLAQSDLVYTITKVDTLADGAVLLDTVADAKELRYEYYEIRLPPTAGAN